MSIEAFGLAETSTGAATSSIKILSGGSAPSDVYMRWHTMQGAGVIKAFDLAVSVRRVLKSNGTSECDNHGSAGTVFVKDASQTYGTLLIDNVANMPAQAFTRPVTLVTGEGDWTFDRLGLGRRAILSVPEGRTGERTGRCLRD